MKVADKSSETTKLIELKENTPIGDDASEQFVKDVSGTHKTLHIQVI